jgi:hypothetical protein
VVICERKNRITHELTGTVVSYIAAALYSMDDDTGAAELAIRRQDVPWVCVAAEGNGWLVLQQQEHVVDALVASSLNQRVLDLPDTQIRFASQIKD